jgi:hypothetical protein
MKKIIYLLALQFFILNSGTSQETFLKQIDVLNDDYGTYICPTKDGGYIITGVTNAENNNEDIVLVKTNMYGDTLWAKVFGGEKQEDSFCVLETMDNGFIIAGYSNSFGSFDWKAYIIKTDEFGDTIWTKTFDGYFSNVIQTQDSSYFLVGKDSTSVMKKLDNSGNVLWSKNYNFCKRFMESQVISENRIAVVGISKLEEPPYSTTIDLFMTNINGDSIWFNQYGGVNLYNYLSIKQTFDKGFIISATETYFFEYSNIYLQKVDSLGNSQWVKTFGGEYTFDYAKSVIQTSDGCYVVTGDRDLGLILLKTDGLGNLMWEKRFDSDSINSNGNCIKNTVDNKIIVIGEARGNYPPPRPKDILLIKTDNDGIITNIFESKSEFTKEPFIYPNPNNGSFSLLLSENDKYLKVLSLNGKIIFEKQLNFTMNETLSIKNIDKGCYIISIKTTDGLKSEKVLIY